jgi:3-(3-hydroxy-phenyl)propionate hydroxylase
MLDVSDFPTRHPYTLGLMQNHIERILAGWIDELAVPVLRGHEVTGLSQDDTGVDVHLDDGEKLHALYVVGADGGRSVIRQAARIEFPGWEATTSALIAEVEVTEELPAGATYDASGIHGLSLMENRHTVRVVSSEPEFGHTTEPTLADLRENLTAVYGTDFGVHNPTWISRFTDATRQAATYRKGRVLLAGDAAHIHSPAGGQGVGLGIQDAVNLGWKLAQVVRGVSPDGLLDTYHAERHPAGARTLQYTMAASALQRQDARIGAVRDPGERVGRLRGGAQVRRRTLLRPRCALRPR